MDKKHGGFSLRRHCGWWGQDEELVELGAEGRQAAILLAWPVLQTYLSSVPGSLFLVSDTHSISSVKSFDQAISMETVFLSDVQMQSVAMLCSFFKRKSCLRFHATLPPVHWNTVFMESGFKSEMCGFVLCWSCPILFWFPV